MISSDIITLPSSSYQGLFSLIRDFQSRVPGGKIFSPYQFLAPPCTKKCTQSVLNSSLSKDYLNYRVILHNLTISSPLLVGRPAICSDKIFSTCFSLVKQSENSLAKRMVKFSQPRSKDCYCCALNSLKDNLVLHNPVCVGELDILGLFALSEQTLHSINLLTTRAGNSHFIGISTNIPSVADPDTGLFGYPDPEKWILNREKHRPK